jgi:hypothetical protein
MRVPNRLASDGGGPRGALARFLCRLRPAIRRRLGRAGVIHGPARGGRRRPLSPRSVAVTGFGVGVLLAMAFLTGTNSSGWLMGLQRAAGMSRTQSGGPAASTPVTEPSAQPSDAPAEDASGSPAVFGPSPAPDTATSDSPGGSESVPLLANTPARGVRASRRNSSPTASGRFPSASTSARAGSARQARLAAPSPRAAAAPAPRTPQPVASNAPGPASGPGPTPAPSAAGRGGVLGLLGI